MVLVCGVYFLEFFGGGSLLNYRREGKEGQDPYNYVRILKKVQKTSSRMSEISVREFSAEIEPKRARVSILLHPLAQLYTTPSPDDVVKYLKKYFFKALRDEGIEIEREKVDEILEPVLKDFLEEIFEMAEEFDVKTPRCYEELHEKLKKK